MRNARRHILLAAGDALVIDGGTSGRSVTSGEGAESGAAADGEPNKLVPKFWGRSTVEAKVKQCRVELFVEDLTISSDFYCDVLKFSMVSRSGSYVGLESGSVYLGLCDMSWLPPKASVGFSQESVKRGRGAGVEIVFVVEELAAMYEHVSGFPGVVVEGLAEQPWGLTDFRVVDPDGYYIRITD